MVVLNYALMVQHVLLNRGFATPIKTVRMVLMRIFVVVSILESS